MPHLTWRPGAVQTGYLIARWVPGGDTVFLPPSGAPLAGVSTSYDDPLPLSSPAVCYLLVPLGGDPPTTNNVLGLSDLLCRVANTAFGDPLPPFSLRLDESSVATLSWSATDGLVANRLLVVPLDGSDPQLVPVGAPPSLTYPTSSRPTCFQMQATVGTIAVRSTNLVCAVPGLSTLGAASEGAAATVLSATNSPDRPPPRLAHGASARSTTPSAAGP
jgi:hypothetical protein